VYTLYVGAGLALVAGLGLGAVMRPDLSGEDRLAGPQIVAETPEPAPAPIDDSLRLTRYSGKIPDYVLGTDWSRPRAPPPPEPQETRVLTAASDEPIHRLRLPRSLREAEAAYEDARQGERTVLVATADLDAAAPPQAAGDDGDDGEH
jgi:hypothetical protein